MFWCIPVLRFFLMLWCYCYSVLWCLLCYGFSLCYRVNLCYGFCLGYSVCPCYGGNACDGVIPFYCVNLLWMEPCRLEVGAWRSPRLLLVNMVPFWTIVVRGALQKNLHLFLEKIQNSETHSPLSLIWMPLIFLLRKFWF